MKKIKLRIFFLVFYIVDKEVELYVKYFRKLELKFNKSLDRFVYNSRVTRRGRSQLPAPSSFLARRFPRPSLATL